MVGSVTMSYAMYKVVHLLGVVFLFTAIGGTLFLRLASVRSAVEDLGADVRKLTGMVHGVALLVILVAGFGALVKLPTVQEGVPGWVWAKLVIWLLLGAVLPLIRKVPRAASILWWLLPLLGGAAAWLAVYKPF